MTETGDSTVNSMLMTRRTRGTLGGTAVTGHDDISNLPHPPRASARARRTVKHRERQVVARELADALADA